MKYINKIKLANLILNLILFCSLFYSCCFFSSDDDNSTIKIALNDKITSLDPAIGYDLSSGKIIYQIYETLYEYHYLKRPYTLVPLLASDLPQYSNGGKTITIPIKKEIFFYPDPCFKNQNREIHAQDFINQFKRLAFNPLHSSGEWIIHKIEGVEAFKEQVGNDFNKLLTTDISGLKALTPHKLQITLKSPDSQFLYFLAMSHIVPIPHEAIIYYNNDLAKNAIGTGPFILSEMNDEFIILEKNKFYKTSYYPQEGDRSAHYNNLIGDAGKRLPLSNKIKIYTSLNPNNAFDLFLEKKIDILERIPNTKYHEIFDHQGQVTKKFQEKKIKVQLVPTLTYWWLSFNMNHSLLGKNKHLRYAIAYALDRVNIIKKFTHKTGLLANSIYPPGILGHDPKSELHFNYDLNRAKEFLVKAGYPDGKNLPTLHFDLRNSSEQAHLQAKVIKKQLEKIGIKIEIIPNTFSDFLIKNSQGKTEIWQGGWSLDFPDPLNVLQLLAKKNFPPGPNKNFYHNHLVEQKIKKMEEIQDSFQRKIVLDEIEAIVLNDLPWIPLYYERSYILYHRNLINYRYSDFSFNHLKYWKKNN